jgi:hypothetical protein
MTQIVPVPGQVRSDDVEDQAEELAAAAEHLPALLTAFGREPTGSLDAIAVFRRLSRAAEAMGTAAAELHRQEWVGVGAEPDAAAAWNGALEGLKPAASTFGWVADGWI